MQVHEKVYQYITENNINQSAIAKKCNIPEDEFSAMMSGTQKMYAEDLRAICYALKVSPEVFINYKSK